MDPTGGRCQPPPDWPRNPRQAGVFGLLTCIQILYYHAGHEVRTTPDAAVPALWLDLAPAVQTRPQVVREPDLPFAVLGPAKTEAEEAPEERVKHHG